MPPELSGIPLNSLTPSALLGLFVVAVLVGWLVPRRVAREAEARWREAYTLEAKAHAATREQVAELLEQGRLTNAILAEARDRSGAVGGS